LFIVSASFNFNDEMSFLKSTLTLAVWLTATNSCLTADGFITTAINQDRKRQQSSLAAKYKHGLAILRMPSTSIDRIANEAILETAMQNTRKLSVVLRSRDDNHSLSSLRKYVGEVYSMLWDCNMGAGGMDDDCVSNVVVYAQNLPNAAPEQWIHHREDLDMVCSHDSLCGWFSESASGRGFDFARALGRGVGGLDDHVAALNADREGRGLSRVQALHVEPWPKGASVEFQIENHVVFMDDENLEDGPTTKTSPKSEDDGSSLFLGGARIVSKSLYQTVCVGGTFDGMHFGHRKLLTLAVSSVLPQSGKLLVGVTVDDMLKNKKFANLIPPLAERMAGVRDFLDRLAPGMKNRVKIVPISDPYGPPGSKEYGKDFDALVLSHETLENGHLLNEHRVHTLGFKPLVLLCTRRTEAYGMSSTALRKRRNLESV
jgi:cytidyltransferase-like protein